MKQVVELIVLGQGATQLSQCLAPLLIVTERICSADYLYHASSTEGASCGYVYHLSFL